MAWLGTWANRKKIVIDKDRFDSDQTHFPVPVPLGASVGQDDQDLTAVFDELGANSKKIAFTKADGTTQLYGEIEHWDNSGEKAVIWVSKSDWVISSSADTVIYLYFDSAQADNTTYIGDVGSTPGRAVWDANFKAVYHLAQDPNGDVADSIKDSTSNANHGTPVGTMTTADLIDGLIGKAIQFDGNDDYIDIGDMTDMDGATEATFEMAGILDALNLDAAFARKWYSGGKAFGFGLDDVVGDEIRILINDATPANPLAVDSYAANLAVDTDYVLAFSWGGGTSVQAVKDGAALSLTYIQNNSQVSIPDVAEHLSLGARYNAGSPNLFNEMQMRDLRISNTERSFHWLKATRYALIDDLIVFTAVEHWLDTWANRIKITIDSSKIDSDQTHFPVPIVLGTSVGQDSQDLSAVFDELGSNSKKIVITEADGETQLFGEIEHWDSVNEKAVIWVSKHDLKIDNSIDTTLYLYYDITQADNVDYIGDTQEENTVTNITGDDFTNKILTTDVDDDFPEVDGDEPNTDLWDVNVDLWGTGLNDSDITIESNKLNIPANTGNSRGNIVSKYKLSGDFDIQVDIDASNCNSTDWEGAIYWWVDEPNRGGGNFSPALFEAFNSVNNIWDTGVSAARTNDIGAFGIKRVGTTITIQYKDGLADSWNTLTSFTGVADDCFVVLYNYHDGVTTGTVTFDNFIVNSGTINWREAPNKDLWGVSGEVAGAICNIKNNKLEFDVTSLISGLNCDSVFRLSGDFDFQFDFELIVAPNTNIWLVGFYLSKVDDSTFGEVDIRYNSSKMYYGSTYDGGTLSDTSSTSDTSGKIRATRSGTTTTFYYWNGSSWTTLHTRTTSEDDLFVHLRTQTTSALTFNATIDNFVINSGTVKYIPSTRVWDDYYTAVYNMAQDPNGDVADSILDSTINEYHGTPVGSMTTADLVDGIIGKGLAFDGVDDFINLAAQFADKLGESFTIEVVFNTDHEFVSNENRNYLAINDSTGATNRFLMFIDDDSGVTDLQMYNGAHYELRGTFDDGSFQVTALTLMDTNNVIKHYYDGADISEDMIPALVSSVVRISTTDLITIGQEYDTGPTASNFWAGIICSVRFSDIDRNPAWLKATNYALTDDLLTFTIGSTNEMTATGITAGTPVLGAPTLDQIFNVMTALGITTGVPVLGAPILVSTVQTPVILPAAGGYRAGTRITITCTTPGATIYYTTDGSTPDAGDTEYVSAFLLSDDVTVKAIGIRSGWVDSAIATTIYTLATSSGTGRSDIVNEPPRAEIMADLTGRVSLIWHQFFVELRDAANRGLGGNYSGVMDSSGGSGSDGGQGGGASIITALESGLRKVEELTLQIMGLGNRPDPELGLQIMEPGSRRDPDVIDMVFQGKSNQVAKVVPVLDTEDYFNGENVEDVLEEIGETRRENGWDLLDPDTWGDLSFVNGTRTFTVAVQGGQTSYHFWVHNKKIIKTASETVIVPNVTGTYYIVFGNDGVLLAVEKSALASDDFYQHAITGLVYWNATTGLSFVGSELHGKTMDSRTHHYNHVTYGARYEGPGMAITGLVGGDPNYTNTSSGFFWDEDIRHTVALQSTHGFIYRSGADGAWVGTALDNELGYLVGGDTYMSWNEWTGATWQLTEGGSTTDFFITFLVATPDITGATVKKIIGQNAYKNRSAAQAAIESELDTLITEGLPSEEFVFLAAWIVTRGGDLELLGDGSTHLDLRTIKGGTSSASGASSVAADITTDTTNFDGILSAADTDVQKALDTLDDAAGGSSLPSISAGDAGKVLTVNAGETAWESAFRDAPIIEVDDAAITINSATSRNKMTKLTGATADRIATMPAMTSALDGMIFGIMMDCDGFVLSIQPNGATERIWNSGLDGGLELIDRSAFVWLKADFSELKWDVVHSGGGRVHAEGLKLWAPLSEMTMRAVSSTTCRFPDLSHRHLIAGAGGVSVKSYNSSGVPYQSYADFNGSDGDAEAAYIAGEFDVFSSLTENWTVMGRIFCSTGSQNMYVLTQYEGSNNNWSVSWRSGNTLRVVLMSGGSVILQLDTTTVMSTSTWYNWAICVVGGDVGIYVGTGTTLSQEDFDTAWTVDTLTGNLFISQQGDDTNYFDGNQQEILIAKQNLFSAAPVVGLTDTIEIPNILNLIMGDTRR